MFKRIMVVLAVVAAGTMGLGVAHAENRVATVSNNPGFMYAHCNGQGVLSQTTNKGATGCTKERRKGLFTVTFNQSVRNCAFQATLGVLTTNGISDPGEATASQGSTDFGVNVITGTTYPVYRAFFLTVLC